MDDFEYNFPDNPLPGDKHHAEDGTDWICSLDGTQWLKYEQNADGSINTGLTQYDLNKLVVEQLNSKITNGQLKESRQILKALKEETKNQYFMLLCNDIHYYTVLRLIETDQDCIKFHNLVIELLQDHGEIKLIEWMNVNHDAVECWVTREEGTIMFLLFPYDWGVIECV